MVIGNNQMNTKATAYSKEPAAAPALALSPVDTLHDSPP
jgi:hypothetical protein